jgi:hypothetical protein
MTYASFSWIEAEKACTKVLQQHRNVKGLYRRGKARHMLGRNEEAIQGQIRPLSSKLINDIHDVPVKDLRAVLRLQPTNMDAMRELASLIFPDGINELDRLCAAGRNNNSSSSSGSGYTPSSEKEQHQERLRRLGIPLPKSRPPPFPHTRADDRNRNPLVDMGKRRQVRCEIERRKRWTVCALSVSITHLGIGIS